MGQHIKALAMMPGDLSSISPWREKRTNPMGCSLTNRYVLRCMHLYRSTHSYTHTYTKHTHKHTNTHTINKVKCKTNFTKEDNRSNRLSQWEKEMRMRN